MKDKLNFERLTLKLGYQFNDIRLLHEALTHRSVAGGNNERLEFLGDSIVNFIIAEALYQKFPLAKEGELSRLRANLVKGDTLAKVAKEIGLGDCLKLGIGELKSGGFRRISILADALEAIIAAIYLDSDFNACAAVVAKLFDKRLNDVKIDASLKDAKTQLQEFLQAKKLPLPDYEVERIEGDAHDQTFYMYCRVSSLNEQSKGSGMSRRKAEQEAAMKLLHILQEKLL